jgi:hypothetical protein
MRWQAVALALAGAVLAAAGCAGATGPAGTVTGTYIRVGGPANTANVPLPGTVSFRAADGTTISVTSGRTGTFTGHLPPGTYAVTATSSLINDGKSTCSRPLTTRVLAGKTVSLTIICDIM